MEGEGWARLVELGLGYAEGDEEGVGVRTDGDRSGGRAMGVELLLAEALDLNKAAPGRGRRDLIVALNESCGGRGVGRNGQRVAGVDVHQLGAERAAEGG